MRWPRSPTAPDLPWQRIINARGEVSPRKHGEGHLTQRRLLEREGVRFDANGRVDLARHASGRPRRPAIRRPARHGPAPRVARHERRRLAHAAPLRHRHPPGAGRLPARRLPCLPLRGLRRRDPAQHLVRSPRHHRHAQHRPWRLGARRQHRSLRIRVGAARATAWRQGPRRARPPARVDACGAGQGLRPRADRRRARRDRARRGRRALLGRRARRVHHRLRRRADVAGRDLRADPGDGRDRRASVTGTAPSSPTSIRSAACPATAPRPSWWRSARPAA